MEPNRVGRETVLATLRLTQSLLERHGPRIAGTRQCLNAADQIAEMLRVHCDKVYQERFEMHPGSFWNVGKVMSVAYLLSFLFLFAGGTFMYLSPAVGILGLVYGIVIYVFNGKQFDGLFPRADGCNVIGVIEPAGEVKRQIILSGHHDSPYVVSFLLNWKRLARFRLILAVVTYVVMLGVSVSAAIWDASGTGGSVPLGAIAAVAFFGLVFVAPLYTVITRLQSPGAGDNLNATAMAITAAVHFSLKRKKGTPLKNTRLIILSTDGEEVGMRGAADYAERHKSELLSVPTSVFNMDSIFTIKDLSLLTRDRNGTCRLSKEMARECHEIAAELGYFPNIIPIPPGGGGTDAAAFAKIGVEATSVIGLSVHGIGNDTVYHTPQDTVDHIEPEAVEAVLDIAINYVMRKDEEEV
jgi:aminopeptidase YwaD